MFPLHFWYVSVTLPLNEADDCVGPKEDQGKVVLFANWNGSKILKMAAILESDHSDWSTGSLLGADLPALMDKTWRWPGGSTRPERCTMTSSCSKSTTLPLCQSRWQPPGLCFPWWPYQTTKIATEGCKSASPVRTFVLETLF